MKSTDPNSRRGVFLGAELGMEKERDEIATNRRLQAIEPETFRILEKQVFEAYQSLLTQLSRIARRKIFIKECTPYPPGAKYMPSFSPSDAVRKTVECYCLSILHPELGNGKFFITLHVGYYSPGSSREWNPHIEARQENVKTSTFVEIYFNGKGDLVATTFPHNHINPLLSKLSHRSFTFPMDLSQTQFRGWSLAQEMNLL